MKLNGLDIAVIGLLDAGVHSGYGVHGFPATKLGKFTKELIPDFHWNVNEKVSLELAVGVSSAGFRSFVLTKQAGINVMYDTLVNAVVHGIGGGIVILAADDIGCYGSTVEQDSRMLGKLAGIPVFDPSSPADVRMILPQAFKLSEEAGIPVMVRLSSTLLSLHEEINDIPARHALQTPHRVIREVSCGLSKIGRKHFYHTNTLPHTKKIINDLPFLYQTHLHPGSIGIISSGPCSNYVPEGPFSQLNLNIAWPLDELRIINFLQAHESVLIIEEPSSFVEQQLNEMVGTYKLGTTIIGRSNRKLPACGPIESQCIANILLQLSAQEPIEDHVAVVPFRSNKISEDFVPLHKTYEAITKYAQQTLDPIVTDVGTSTYLCHEPYAITDLCYGLGSSIGIALGISAATGHSTAVIGDYGFIHSGLQSLVEGLHRKINIKVIIVNDYLSRKTGSIPHCISPTEDETLKVLSIEELILGCGVEQFHFLHIDENTDVSDITAAILALPDQGVSVLLCNLMTTVNIQLSADKSKTLVL